MELFYDLLAVKSEKNPYNQATTNGLDIYEFYKNVHFISVCKSSG
jgi:hypothetical protein